jgi:plasmid maintenance system antidote protein VapI
MPTAQYLELLEWTAHRVVAGKSAATPKHVARLMQRLGLSEDIWCSLVKDFGPMFGVVAKQPHRIDEHRSSRTNAAESTGHQYRARRKVREFFTPA